MHAFLHRCRRVHAVLVGVCVGLIVNLSLVPVAQAGTASGLESNPTPIEPEPVPDWGEAEYSQANSEIYEFLFPGQTWNQTSTMSIDSPALQEGRNNGVNDHGIPFVLQAFFIDEMSADEASVSLTPEQQNLWASGNVRVEFFFGFIAQDLRVKAVAGFVYSSNVMPDAQIAVTKVFDDEHLDTLFGYWSYKWRQADLGGEAGGNWDWWWCMPFASVNQTNCQEIEDKCWSEYESNMRIAISTYKAIWATAGLACIVGGIMMGSFCLVGNLLACATVSWGAARCAVVLGGATAALGIAALASRIALLDCLGPCAGSMPGCP